MDEGEEERDSQTKPDEALTEVFERFNTQMRSMSADILRAAKVARRINERYRPAIQGMLQASQRMRSSLEGRGLVDSINRIARQIEELPARQKEAWSAAAERGWYINALTPVRRLNVYLERDRLDAFMVEHLEQNWAEICSKIIEAAPDRKHILDEAFRLHEEGRYTASIPLFMTQIEGLCKDALGESPFFRRRGFTDRVDEIVSGRETDSMVSAALHALKVDAPVLRRSDALADEHSVAPSRHAVLHGDRRHLDYGSSKVKSLSTFSLLAFVAFILPLAGRETISPE